MHPIAALLAGWIVAGAPAGSPAREDRAAGGVEFRWDAPAGCPGEAAIRAQVVDLLGGVPLERRDRRLTAIARVRREEGDGWSLRLWTVTPKETRERSMTGPDCAVLAEAAALLAAMAIDPAVFDAAPVSSAARAQAGRAEEVSEPSPVPESGPGQAVRGPEPEPTRPEARAPPKPSARGPEKTGPPGPQEVAVRSDRSRARQVRGFVGAAAGAGYGELPGVGPVLRVRVGAAWPHARLVFSAQYGVLRRARFADAGDRGADVQQAFAAVGGCGVPAAADGRLEFPVCAVFEAGALSGRGVGYATTSRGTVPWLAVALRVGLLGRVGRRMALGLSMDPWVALVRGRFRTDDGTVLWQPLPAGVRVTAGLEVRF